MWIFKRVADIQAFLQSRRQQKQSIGFVPTMGALHRGHIHLIETCNAKTDVSICSIFVNPTQFNDKKDLEKYPRTIEKDIHMLANAGCDVLFLPDTRQIYPQPVTTQYNLGSLEQLFEGSARPGHFQGVCQVVDRLFTIIQPDETFFGQKDYQQCMVVKRLLDVNPTFQNIKLHIEATIREADGLAMSSRNSRLTPEQRQAAPAIYKTLVFLKENIQPGNLKGLLGNAAQQLTAAGFVPDYVALANAATLQPVETWDGKTPLVALIAAFLGEVRLIDNLVIRMPN